MLERIIISKVRFKILKTFLLNPEAEHHLRGLVRLLGEEINAVRRETKNLELFGILKSKRQANKIVYRLNKNSMFLGELKSMFLKDTPEMQMMYDVFKKLDGIYGVIVTKAYITQEYTNENDVDILVVGNPNVHKLGKEINKVEKEIGRDLRLGVVTKEDFEFKRKRREQFIVDILENENIVLVGEINKMHL